MSDYFDRQGNPLTLDEYLATLKGDIENARRVAETHLGDAGRDGPWVSTVWLGMNHNWLGSGPPIIFESMAFGLPGDVELCERYATEAQALAGHKRMVTEAHAILERSPTPKRTLSPWEERAIVAEAELAQALDIIRWAHVNVRALTGGDERRMRAFLERHERRLNLPQPPRRPSNTQRNPSTNDDGDR